MRIFRILKEISNYFFIKKVTKKNIETEAWKKFNLRQGWFGILYTVINLPPEVFNSDQAYYQAYVMEQMIPMNAYLESLNLAEVIVPKVERLEGKAAYGVKYYPLFNDFTIGWCFKWGSIISIALYLQHKYDWYSKAEFLYHFLFTYFKNLIG